MSGSSESPPNERQQLRHAAAQIAATMRENDRLRHHLLTLAEHWPGKITGLCVGCDGSPWPCQVVADVMGPYLDEIERRLTLRRTGQL